MARTSGASNVVDVEADLMHETEHAYKIRSGNTTCWVPKSVCEYDGKITFTMPEKIAFEKGLI